MSTQEAQEAYERNAKIIFVTIASYLNSLFEISASHAFEEIVSETFMDLREADKKVIFPD